MNKLSDSHIIFFLVIILIFLNNCAKVRESAGVARKTPDEYTIVKNSPLELPPDYNLLPSEEILAKKKSKNNEDLAKEIIFGLGEETEQTNINSSSSLLNSILEKTGANTASLGIREAIDKEYKESITSSKGVFSGEKYMTEEEILDAVKESERIRNNLFNNQGILEGDTPITTRPNKRSSKFKNLF